MPFAFSGRATFAQFERRLISQRTNEALAVKCASGVRLGRPPTLAHTVIRRIQRQRALRDVHHDLRRQTVEPPAIKFSQRRFANGGGLSGVRPLAQPKLLHGRSAASPRTRLASGWSNSSGWWGASARRCLA